jgi:TonB family protein
MRKLVIGLALTLFASGLSFAAGSSDPVWDKGPDRSDFAKAYPSHAAQAGISGAVKMRCSASEAGLLKDCAVISEAPTGEGFGAAALSLAAGMELKPTTSDGKSVAGQSFIVPVKFEPGVLNGPAVITNVDWLRRPTNDELLNYWPSGARDDSDGSAVLHCAVTNRGLMDGCSVSGEKPAGHGYGSAVLAMANLFVMRPMTVDGEPVGGGTINIPIRFVGPPPKDPDQMGGTVKVFRAAPWIAAPNNDQMAAAFPAAAVGKISAAHVLLRCSMRDDGTLGSCDGVSEEPSNKGFDRAARSLIKDFRLPPAPKAHAYGNFRVDLPFDFRDPSQSAPPVEITDPIWIKQVDPAAIVKIFPEAAIKAGFKTGRASLECSIVNDGTLTGCTTVTEEPAGYGFADAALMVASVMQMSPWTKQGAPAGGAKIVLPVKFVLPDAAQAPGAPIAAPPKP